MEDPLDISKDQVLVKEAQGDLSKIDVLVCGGCHEVFYFIEEFQNHKQPDQCTNISVLKCENEEKSQIWGFTLWKTKQIQTLKSQGENLPSSWEIYQRWTKLNQIEKDLWISAGQSLQYTYKTGTTKLVKLEAEKVKDKDPLAMDDDVTPENEGGKKAVRTAKKDNQKEEFNVEKITGKRFNPRKRYWEYEVKWENYAEHTWEPLIHLSNCKDLVQDYENKLKLEKEKEKEVKPPGKGRGRPPKVNSQPGTPQSAVKVVPKKPALPVASPYATSPGGRPQRSSKQKALEQVKSWCGNISDEEGKHVAIKRHRDDVDSDDSFEREMKVEPESSEDEEIRTPAKKIPKIVHAYANGTGRKLPDNVLIPDAQGVVRISQKQLPALSSGVYIMSKSSGIIKLDSTASKIATSGGQAIVKVSPRVGQTQIKIIKKEDVSKKGLSLKDASVKIASSASSGSATTTSTVAISTTPKPKIQLLSKTIGKQSTPKAVLSKASLKQPVKKEVKKVETPKVKAVEKKEAPKASPIFQQEDDSDDGIPELEFPTDLPLPAPESPPGEFTLDPTTGKVVGVEYPEPEIEPEIVPEKDAAKDLDNIVKLAAADITEEDLKTENEVAEQCKIGEEQKRFEAPSTTSAATAPTTTAAAASILTAAIVNSNILQKTLQSPTPKPKSQPRIINQSVAKPRTPIATVVRTPKQPQGASRTPQSLQRSKPNLSPLRTPKNVYPPQRPQSVKKIGHTTIATKTVVKKPMAKVSSPAPKPKPISMPSLEEDLAVAVPAASPQSEAVADLSSLALAAGGQPLFVTGDDGTVYQVAGQNEDGQTILVTQGPDGQQQCLLVASEVIEEQMASQLEVQEQEEQPLVAQFIRTEPPSPGGTHKVVVMLPDGDMMVTQVTPEEYASLELDK